ncbi:MAG: bifunctional hydroxymethylpyrimidine kinase/phosphomethylpyrimidine kinase, partial [Oscillospiraceae bacterium]|nr:bifunctional hydroxymethylpyrimidine kinase/phosphomethylpyrimidine kinase [Oscillospiraceae bacterium]
GYSKENGYFTVACCYTPVYYPGTGDLFTAVLTGFVLQNYTLQQAVFKAARFVEKCVQATFDAKTSPQLGVCLEPMLKFLMGENNIG